MIVNVLHIAVMAIIFLYMFNKAEFNATRLVALVPLGMILVDVCAVRADFLSVPFLAVLMALARLTIIGCCVGAMRRDRQLARARARRQARARMQMRTAAITPAVSSNVYALPQYA